MKVEEDPEEVQFVKTYRNAGFFSRLFYAYGDVLINTIQGNDYKMTEAMIEDMTDVDGETEKMVKQFQEHLRIETEKWRLTKQEPGSFYYPVRNAIWLTFRNSTLSTAFIYYFAEFFAIGYTSFLIVLIGYLADENAPVKHGIAYLMVFAAMMFGSVINKNKYIFDGYTTAIKLRKTLIASLYDKVTKLSMKSLAETNSGKLVTIVSGDI
jgi:ABC-type multidrug transport system fused ATPase/permease subunit